jgi:biotin synthase
MRVGIRVSYGSAIELGLAEGKLAARPRTAYLFMSDGACRGRCAFCPQSSGAHSDKVSRVSWPEYPLDSVLEAVRSSRSIERVCLQCSDEERVLEDLPPLVRRVVQMGSCPVSVSLPPPEAALIGVLKDAGADRLTVPIDCADPRLILGVKGRNMTDYLDALARAVAIFGRDRVGTHLIVGLGEAEKDVVSMLAHVWDMGVRPSLFAFTPVKGTAMERLRQPALATYRRLQLAMYMIVELEADRGDFAFDTRGKLAGYPISETALASMVKGGRPFETRGCLGCNRPYFNERVLGFPFNFPYPPSEEEKEQIREDLCGSITVYQ